VDTGGQITHIPISRAKEQTILRRIWADRLTANVSEEKITTGCISLQERVKPYHVTKNGEPKRVADGRKSVDRERITKTRNPNTIGKADVIPQKNPKPKGSEGHQLGMEKGTLLGASTEGLESMKEKTGQRSKDVLS